MGPVWLVGCGRLGQAMLAGWLAAGLPPDKFTVINPSPRALPEGIAQVAAPSVLLPRPAAIVLAVKPAMLGAVAPALAPHAGGTALLSVLAGVRLERLEAAFPGAAVTRAFPNTAVRIGRSVTLMAGARKHSVDVLVGALGTCVWLDEALFDTAGALSASGPAFVFAYIEALASAGVAGGLASDVAARIARDTVAGAAALASVDPRPPSALREEVTSKGGMTQAGLAVLERDGALTTLAGRAIAAAAMRSSEMGREA